MREIKFRAWDNNRHGYCYFDLFHCWGGLVKGTGIPYLDIRENITEQFTGLRDKNGREIYEGDIVKAWIDFGPGGEGLEIYEVIIGLHGTSLQPWTFEEPGFLPEVIGNIHENPEMLK